MLQSVDSEVPSVASGELQDAFSPLHVDIEEFEKEFVLRADTPGMTGADVKVRRSLGASSQCCPCDKLLEVIKDSSRDAADDLRLRRCDWRLLRNPNPVCNLAC